MRNQILELAKFIDAGIDPDDFYDISIDKYKIALQGHAVGYIIAKYEAMGYKFEYCDKIHMLKASSDNIKIVFTL